MSGFINKLLFGYSSLLIRTMDKNCDLSRLILEAPFSLLLHSPDNDLPIPDGGLQEAGEGLFIRKSLKRVFMNLTSYSSGETFLYVCI